MMTRKGMRYAVYSLLVVLLLALGAGGVSSQELTPISLGYTAWVGYGPLFIARDQGYFAEQGLDVTLVSVENVSDRFVALAGGDLHGLVTTLDVSGQFCNPESPFKVILALDESAGGDGMVASPAIASVADLAGKQVGVNIGSVSQFFLEYVLRQNDMTSDDLTLIRMQQGDVPAALAAGRVDAGVTWEPHLSTSVDNGAVLLTSSKDTPGLIVDILLLRQDVLDATPEVATGIVNAWNAAIEYWKENPDEAAAMMASGLGAWYDSADAVNADLAGVNLLDAEENAAFFGGTGDVSAESTLSFALEFYTGIGVIEEACATSDILDPSFVAPAAAEATPEATAQS